MEAKDSKRPNKLMATLLIWVLLLATCASDRAVPASVVLPTRTAPSSFVPVSATAIEPTLLRRPLLPLVELEAMQTPVASSTRKPSNTNKVDPSALVTHASIPLFASSPEFPNSPESYLDLDTGATPLVPPLLDLPRAAFDLQFVENEGDSSLKAINGALARAMGKPIPGFDGCKQVLTSIKAEHLTAISVGDYFCFLSNQGHLSQIKVEKLAHLGEGSIRVEIKTWQPTVAPPVTPTVDINASPTATIVEKVTDSHDRVSGLLSLFAEPSIGFSEVVNLPASYLDLDQGVTEDVTGGDIQFAISVGSMAFETLQPVNGARSRPMGQSEPGFEGCKQAIDSFGEGNIPEVDGTYLCFLTNQGRLSQVRVERHAYRGRNSILLSFITWKEIVVPNTPTSTPTPTSTATPTSTPTVVITPTDKMGPQILPYVPK